MSEALVASPAVSSALKAEPEQRRWSRQEFHHLADLGFFQGQKAELIEGEIMVLSPQKPEHFSVMDRVAEILRSSFGKGYHMRMQGPLDLGPHSEPEPDVAVVVGKRVEYRKKHPQTAALLVEVSDTTLAFDRTRKASLYARAGIGDYWIVNLVDRQVEVYRGPQVDAGQPYGHAYADKKVIRPGDSVVALARIDVSIAVDDVLAD